MIKYWRGKHIILKKEDIINDYLERIRRRPRDKEISSDFLKWKPYEPTNKEKRQVRTYCMEDDYPGQGWGAGAGCFWLLGAGAGAAWKKTRSRSRLEKKVRSREDKKHKEIVL